MPVQPVDALRVLRQLRGADAELSARDEPSSKLVREATKTEPVDKERVRLGVQAVHLSLHKGDAEERH